MHHRQLQEILVHIINTKITTQVALLICHAIARWWSAHMFFICNYKKSICVKSKAMSRWYNVFCMLLTFHSTHALRKFDVEIEHGKWILASPPNIDWHIRIRRASPTNAYAYDTNTYSFSFLTYLVSEWTTDSQNASPAPASSPTSSYVLCLQLRVSIFPLLNLHPLRDADIMFSDYKLRVLLKP